MSITALVTHDTDLAYRRERAMNTFTRVGRRGWRARLLAATTPKAGPAISNSRGPASCLAARVPAQRPA